MRLLITSIVLTLIYSCNSELDSEYIKSKTWSYQSGFKIGRGDFLVFNPNHKIFQLKNDTIYYNSVPVAIVRNLDKKNFVLTVKSLSEDKIGKYRDIEESLQ